MSRAAAQPLPPSAMRDDHLDQALAMHDETCQLVWEYARTHRPAAFAAHFSQRFAELAENAPLLYERVAAGAGAEDVATWRLMRDMRAGVCAGRLTHRQASAAVRDHLRDRHAREASAAGNK